MSQSAGDRTTRRTYVGVCLPPADRGEDALDAAATIAKATFFERGTRMLAGKVLDLAHMG